MIAATMAPPAPASRNRGRDLGTPIDRNIALELVRVTEGAAMAAAPFMGRNRKNDADGAAVDSMRKSLNFVDMDGVVVIGEGEKDEAPMLYIGEQVGNGSAPRVDVAVDPIDGTRLVARGLPGGIATVALAERGSMFYTHVPYMEKLIVGPKAARVIDITDSVKNNLRRIARAEDRHVTDLTVVVLDRPRHIELIGEIRQAGARLRLIPDGDVAGAISTAWEDSGADILFGIGGTPEGVIAAAALRAMGGAIHGRLWPRNDEERQAAIDLGYNLDRVLTTADLVSSDNCFFAATGITDGELLKGVHYDRRGATTQSLVMRSKSGTVRLISARHRLTKLKQYSAIEF